MSEEIQVKPGFSVVNKTPFSVQVTTEGVNDIPYKITIGCKDLADNLLTKAKEKAVQISHAELDAAEQRRDHPGISIDYLPIGTQPVISIAELSYLIKEMVG